LGRVIMNLALNARDAMPQGGRLTIEATDLHLDDAQAAERKLQPGHYVLLSVSDTGIGMDAEIQSHIFEPFFTTSKQFGTGLGLSVVQGIVEQTGGAIRLHSEVGRGTTFQIYLPRAEDPHDQEAKPVHVETARGSEVVLLVEDEEGVRRLARLMLEQSGYTVVEASNGRGALSLCESHSGPIHLLVTDVIMPGMGGRELAERAARLRPEMKLILMSGHTDDVIFEQGVRHGTSFLHKPFNKMQLVGKVREVLDS
jgi:CheY-like chemotaxis protein